MHIYGTVGPPECIFMALQVLSNDRGTSAFFTTFQTYSNVDPLECIFMAPLAIFNLWSTHNEAPKRKNVASLTL